MTYIGVKELRQNLNKYAHRVRKGEGFIVMKHNKPLFQIAPVKVDKWGDEGEWETFIDFTKIRKGGVPAELVLEAFQKLREEESKKKKKKSKRRG